MRTEGEGEKGGVIWIVQLIDLKGRKNRVGSRSSWYFISKSDFG